MDFTRHFLRGRQAQYEKEAERSPALLPLMRRIARAAWKETAAYKGPHRLQEFLLRFIAYSLLVYATIRRISSSAPFSTAASAFCKTSRVTSLS